MRKHAEVSRCPFDWLPAKTTSCVSKPNEPFLFLVQQTLSSFYFSFFQWCKSFILGLILQQTRQSGYQRIHSIPHTKKKTNKANCEPKIDQASACDVQYERHIMFEGTKKQQQQQKTIVENCSNVSLYGRLLTFSFSCLWKMCDVRENDRTTRVLLEDRIIPSE